MFQDFFFFFFKVYTLQLFNTCKEKKKKNLHISKYDFLYNRLGQFRVPSCQHRDAPADKGKEKKKSREVKSDWIFQRGVVLC